MRERKSGSITIYKADGTVRATIVPESSSVRKFTLMGDDYVQLDFYLEDAIPFGIGDHFTDDIFGTFYVTREQLPEWQGGTGGYKYSLQMDAEYIRWKSKIFMLTDKDGNRKECSWSLTDKLENHLEVVKANLKAIYNEDWKVDCSDVEERQKVYCMTYGGVTIIEALNNMADQWETEWWVRDKTIYFGKCEDSDATPYEFELGVNMESMDISDDTQDSDAERLYVYGSTNNLPLTYRKDLVMQAGAKETYTDSGGTAYLLYSFADDRKLDVSLFRVSGSRDVALGGTITKDTATWNTTTGKWTGATFTAPVTGAYKFSGMSDVAIGTCTAGITVKSGEWKGGTDSMTVTLTATLSLAHVLSDGSTEVIDSSTYTQTKTVKLQTCLFTDIKVPALTEVTDVYNLTEDESYRLEVSVSMECDEVKTVQPCEFNDMTATFGAITEQSPTIVTGDAESEKYMAMTYTDSGNAEHTYYLVLNPCNKNKGEYSYYMFALYEKSGTEYNLLTTVPEGFTKEETADKFLSVEFVLDDLGCVDIPTAYYVSDLDNPNAISRLGDRRLQLPTSTNGYIDKTGTTFDPATGRERSIVFEDIYPDGKLMIGKITERKITDYTEYDDNSKAAWNSHEYTLTLYTTKDDGTGKKVKNEVLPFKYKYILPDTTLQIRFLTPNDMGWDEGTITDGCHLAGMTFDLQYNKAANTFTIVRNTDYGTEVPNDTLKPTVDDPCVLIGWNTKAMKDLGLIEEAETRLQEKAEEYMRALKDGQFTFTCTMYSDFMFDCVGDLIWQEANEKTMQYASDRVIYVKNGFSVYAIPQEGAMVTIKHGALCDGTKTSRVIGYELKWDKPYDEPKYTIGETEAYSRLRKIEKEITTLK